MNIKIYISLFLVFWCFALLVEFVIPVNHNLVYAYPIFHKIFSTVCHQESYKLIELDNFHTLACARCTGIYLGAFVSSLINIVFNVRIKSLEKYFLVSGFLVLSDVLLYTLEVYSYSHIIAFVSGSLLGSAGFLYFYKGFEKLLDQKFNLI